MLYLIDAPIFVFRAWHTVPNDVVDYDGNPVNALHGFARFLGDLIEREKPGHIAVAFDERTENSYRTLLYPAYKANRDPARRTQLHGQLIGFFRARIKDNAVGAFTTKTLRNRPAAGMTGIGNESNFIEQFHHRW